VEYGSCENVLVVESVAVMGNYRVSLVEQANQLLDYRFVIGGGFVMDGYRLGFAVASPFPCGGEDVSFLNDVVVRDGKLVVPQLKCLEDQVGCFYVVDQYSRLQTISSR
jgi:hypothetical protein